MKYIGNSFSLQMVKDSSYFLSVEEITLDEFEEIKNDAYSCIGHPDTARVLGVEFNRTNITLENQDTLYVAQLIGGRLPIGTTDLPKDFYFKFLKVKLL